MWTLLLAWAGALVEASAPTSSGVGCAKPSHCFERRGRLVFEVVCCAAAAILQAPCAAWPPQVGWAHADTQEHLVGHLARIWGTEVPRVMVDVGAGASLGEHRNTSDVHFFRDRFPVGRTLAVETVPPLAEHLAASFAGRYGAESSRHLEVVNVFLDVVDDPVPRQLGLEVTALRACCEENAVHPQFVELHSRSIRTYCTFVCEWDGRENSSRWAVPRSRWDSIWQSRLEGQHIDFIKVDFDPGHSQWVQHMLRGWRRFFERRAFSVMSLEFDERGYWEALPQFLSFFRALDYYVFLKWPCTPKRHDGGFQRAAYVPLTDPFMTPAVPPRVAFGRDPHDVLIVDMRQRELFELTRLGNADCGVCLPEPLVQCSR